MQVTTIRLEENTLEALATEAPEHGFRNRTEYIRWILENRERIHENTTGDSLEELRERVDDLEATVADLQGDDVGRDEQPDSEPDLLPEEPAFPSGGAEPASDAGDETDQVASDFEGVLAGWRPGRTASDREHRREIGRRALEWLRERGEPASRSDFAAALYEDTHLQGQGEDSWWRRVVREALQRAVNAELVEYEHGQHIYRWIEE